MKEKEYHLTTVPNNILEGDSFLLRGKGWPDCPAELLFEGKQAKIEKIIQGFSVSHGFRPINGEFVVRIPTYGLKPTRSKIEVRCGRKTAMVMVDIKKRERPKPDEADKDAGMGYWRDLGFFEPRFGHIGYVPEGVAEARSNSLKQIRKQFAGSPHIFDSPPSPTGSNWTPIGPGPIVSGLQQPQTSLSSVSGRVLSIAVDPIDSRRIYIGTVNGGVWRSTDAGTTWSARTDDQPSLAIGALAINPMNPAHIFAGTGEYTYGTTYGNYFGQGLLYSPDGGDTWSPLGGGTFGNARISRILLDPNDPDNHIFVSCEDGAYEGAFISGAWNWLLLRAGSASDIVLVPGDSADPGLHVIAAFAGEGLFLRTLLNNAWSPWIQLTDPAAIPANPGRTALGQSHNNPYTIWAAFSDSSTGYLNAIAKTSDGGMTWTPAAMPASNLGSYDGANACMHISAHPNKPDTVFLGLRQLFRSDSGSPWSEVQSVSVIHMDHHCFAFDPPNNSNNNEDTMYAGCDGGIYRSDDGGISWEQRNCGLGTLQLYAVANHPEWAAIALCGAQDNGGSIYSGAPAWAFLGGTDIVMAAIDSLHRAYIGYYGAIYRSDGLNPPFNNKFSLPFTTEWNFPFALDTANPGVCYTGARALLRTNDGFDTAPTPATNPLVDSSNLSAGFITSIAIHPANPDVVLLATSYGRVYRVQRTGPDWTIPNVTVTDITNTGLPAGLHISCIAVDPSENIWISISSILLTEGPGEFTNDHIYFLKSGESAWENRSSGLLKANPINTLAIDPLNSDAVYCGGDSGVFCWNAVPGSWTLWDEALPNAPIFQLAIHSPSRLIRAATFGRGVWERPLESLAEPLADVYMRDDILDAARGPAPSGVSDPFNPANLVWWWQSEDIKIDASTPAFQTTAPVSDEVSLANLITHRNAKRGVVNRLYVQVHNRGPLMATNVKVRAFFADASLALPDLPGDFSSPPKPFDGTPNAAYWTAVDTAQSLQVLEPGQTAVFCWNWNVPASAADHTCVFAICTCDQDPLDLAGVTDIVTAVNGFNNTTLKNLTIIS